MIVHYPYLIAAVLLLLCPRQILRLGAVTHSRKSRHGGRMGEDPEDRSVRIIDEFSKFRNWVDLGRSLMGAYCLNYLSFAVTEGLSAEVHDATLDNILLAKLAVLLVGMLIQVVRYPGHMVLYAPVTYAIGLTFGMLDPKIAAFGTALVVALNIMLGSPLAFFFGYSIIVLAFGYLFGDLPGFLSSSSVAGALFLPTLLALLGRRALRHYTVRGRLVA